MKPLEIYKIEEYHRIRSGKEEIYLEIYASSDTNYLMFTTYCDSAADAQEKAEAFLGRHVAGTYKKIVHEAQYVEYMYYCELEIMGYGRLKGYSYTWSDRGEIQTFLPRGDQTVVFNIFHKPTGEIRKYVTSPFYPEERLPKIEDFCTAKTPVQISYFPGENKILLSRELAYHKRELIVYPYKEEEDAGI